MKYFILLVYWTLAVVAPGTDRNMPPPRLVGSQAVDVAIEQNIEDGGPPHALLGRILGGSGIPAGVAQIESCSGAPALSIKATRGMTIRQALDAFTASNPSYQWLFEGGVVNVIPKNGAAALLDTAIRGLHLNTNTRQMTADAILHDLISLPEVRERATELQLQPGMAQEFFHGVHKEHPTPIKPAPVVINLKGASLREALNAVVRAYGNRIWVYAERDCNGKTYVLNATSD
jgi:hypothetical protein